MPQVLHVPSAAAAWDPLPPGVHELAGARLVVPPGLPGDRPVRLLVAFHGAGGSAADGLAIVRGVPVDALVLAPSSAGRTWDLILGGLGPDVAATQAALDAVAARYPLGPVALAGFSDGASYALSLGLASEGVDAVLAFSPGFAAPPRLGGATRAYVAHGVADWVLPVERCGRRVVAQLRALGLSVRYEEFDGGHVVRPELVEDAVGWWEAGEGSEAG